MNKALILILALCLVCVHAFVKRDAEEAPKNDDFLKNLQNQFEKAVNPETIKKNVDDLVSKISKAFEDLKPKDTPKE